MERRASPRVVARRGKIGPFRTDAEKPGTEPIHFTGANGANGGNGGVIQHSQFSPLPPVKNFAVPPIARDCTAPRIPHVETAMESLSSLLPLIQLAITP